MKPRSQFFEHTARSARRPAAVFLGCILALVLLGMAALAVEPSVSASLSDTTMAAGDEIELRLSLQADGRLNVPREISADGLEIHFTGQSKNIRMENFKVTSSVELTYTVSAAAPGTFTIPPVEVQVDGKTIRTQPLKLTVTANTASGSTESIFGEIILPKNKAYLGEMVPVELRIYVDARIRWQAEPMPMLEGDGFAKQKLLEPRQTQTRRDGKDFAMLTFRTAITPSKAGRILVGPGQLQIQAQIPRPNRNRPRGGNGSLSDLLDDAFGNDPFFSPSQIKRIAVKAPAVELDVQPLPVAGRPKDFSGAVGQFKLSSEGTPRKVKVGDPITLRMNISGRGNFDRVSAPGLKEPAGWHAYPATGDFKSTDELGSVGIKTFEMAVIPETQKTGMPVVTFSYFDPETAKYETIQSEPQPLIVEPGAVIAPSAPAATTAESPAPATPPPVAAPKAAVDIHGLQYAFGAPRDTFVPLISRPGFFYAQLVPGGLLLAFLAARLRRKDADGANVLRLRRQRSELSQQLRAEKSRPRFFENAARLVQLHTALATGVEPGLVDAAGASAAHPVDPALQAELEEIFSTRAELLYAGTIAGEEPLLETERDRVIAALERLENGHEKS